MHSSSNNNLFGWSVSMHGLASSLTTLYVNMCKPHSWRAISLLNVNHIESLWFLVIALIHTHKRTHDIVQIGHTLNAWCPILCTIEATKLTITNKLCIVISLSSQKTFDHTHTRNASTHLLPPYLHNISLFVWELASMHGYAISVCFMDFRKMTAIAASITLYLLGHCTECGWFRFVWMWRRETKHLYVNCMCVQMFSSTYLFAWSCSVFFRGTFMAI